MKVILLDAMNLIHRARCGFAKGEHAIVYSFFRSLKPIVEKLNPDMAYFVLEGDPQHRSQLLVDYKANRTPQPNSFWKQQKEILRIMNNLPITCIRHPDYECDDVIANLAKYHYEAGNDVIIVSTDSDFIQVFDDMNPDKVKLYHPIKKTYIENPKYSYLTWKALRGDVSDNIPGVKGVGDKTATKIINSKELMDKLMSDPIKKKVFERNKSLIQFCWFNNLTSNLKSEGCESNNPMIDLEIVRQSFKKLGFKSMLTDRYWPKFESAFKNLVI
tara:strand:+ start:4840 stop:5658 length:819 start_codon:yes stop_codon:yes gene_type:complete